MDTTAIRLDSLIVQREYTISSYRFDTLEAFGESMVVGITGTIWSTESGAGWSQSGALWSVEA